MGRLLYRVGGWVGGSQWEEKVGGWIGLPGGVQRGPLLELGRPGVFDAGRDDDKGGEGRGEGHHDANGLEGLAWVGGWVGEQATVPPSGVWGCRWVGGWVGGWVDQDTLPT